jgi:hypothetical protein
MLNKLGLTGSLEPKLDVFGEQVSADLIWGLTPKLLNTNDPVLSWMSDNNVFVGRPNRSQQISGRRGEKRDMTPEEYTVFLESSGKEIYRELERKIRSGRFNRMSQEDKEKAVQSIVRQAREDAKDKIKF